MEKDKPLSDGKSLSEMLIKQNNFNVYLLDYICQYIPALTILELGGITSTNAIGGTTNISSKIYYDNNFDDSSPNSLVPYYLSCVSGSTVLSNEPTDRTFIIRECETYASPSNIQSDIHAKTVNNEIISYGTVCGNDILIYTGGGGSPTTTGVDTRGCHEDCERDCEEGTENIHRFRARNDYDSWRGKGEFVTYSIFSEDVTYE